MNPLDLRVHGAGDVRLDAELRLDRGVTALFGPSGAGKTTMLQCIAGLRTPRVGRIAHGDDVWFDSDRGINVPPHQRRIGFVFQDLRLFPHLTVERNLRYGLREGGVRRIDFAHVVELLELGSLLSRSPSALSGGEARRVALGRALLSSPNWLLLDEPLAGLDEARKGVAIRLLQRVATELTVPMLFVSHDLSEILELTTTIAVVDRGELLGHGELSEVLGQEKVFRLADSLGLESLLPVRILREESGLTIASLGDVEIALPRVDRAPGTEALVAVRPEDVILARAVPENISVRNAFLGTVTRVERLSDRLLVQLDIGAPLRAEISDRSGRALGVEPGAQLYCLVKAFSFRWRRFLSSE